MIDRSNLGQMLKIGMKDIYTYQNTAQTNAWRYSKRCVSKSFDHAQSPLRNPSGRHSIRLV